MKREVLLQYYIEISGLDRLDTSGVESTFYAGGKPFGMFWFGFKQLTQTSQNKPKIKARKPVSTGGGLCVKAVLLSNGNGLSSPTVFDFVDIWRGKKFKKM